MLLYRQFKKELTDVENQLAFFVTNRVSLTDPTHKRIREKAQALNELNKYVDSFDWVKSKPSLDKIKAIIASDFNYSDVATQFGTTHNSLKVTFSRADKVLKSRIELPFNLVMTDKLEEAMQVYKLSTKEMTLAEYHSTLPLLEPVIKLGFTNPQEDIDWSEAVNALKFLNIYAKPKLQVGIERAGHQLGHLLYILLSADTSYTFERELILSYINNNLTLDEVITELTSYQQLLSYNSTQEEEEN